MAPPTPITVLQFREHFPAFSNTTTYPTSYIQLWLDMAQGTVPTTSIVGAGAVIDFTRFGQMYALGIMLWVAHQITIQKMMENGAVIGGPGFGPFPATSRSVNGVSVGYDSSFGQEFQAGWYGLTVWGNQFVYWLRLAGAGPIQL